MDLTPHRGSLVDAGVEARPARRAAAALDAHALDLGAALRRAVPFLVRRGVPVAAVTARAVSLAAATTEIAQPAYVMHLATNPGGWRAALLIDAVACSFFMVGALGGDFEKPLELDAKGLTGPQAAIMSRFAHRIAEAFSDVLTKGAGFGFTKLPQTTGGPPAEASLAAVTLALGEGGASGSLTLLVAKEPLLATTAAPTTRATAVDPRVVATMEDVELNLVVELGRMTMTLGELAALRPGDMLRLDVPIDGTVQVRAGGQTLLSGTPTTAGSRLAVKITSRHGA